MKIKILTVISGIIVLAVGWGIFAAINKSMPPNPAINIPAPVSTTQPPTELKVIAVSDTQANLSWLAPADNKGIVGYMVYRDGQKIGTTPETVYSDSTYSSSIQYSYKVASYNSESALSVFSNIVEVPNKTAATPSPTQPPPTTACGSGGACTAAQVALHHTQADCWVYLSPINKVYNVTAFVANPNTHPGGNVIVSHCGTNVYNYLVGNAGGHPHSNSALNTILESYYISPFQP